MNELYKSTIGSGKIWFAYCKTHPENSVQDMEIRRYLGPLGYTDYYFSTPDENQPVMVIGVEGDITVKIPLDNFFHSMAHTFDIPVLFGKDVNATLFAASCADVRVPSLQAAYNLLTDISPQSLSFIRVVQPEKMGFRESNIRSLYVYNSDLGTDIIPVLMTIDLNLNRDFKTAQEMEFLESAGKKVTSQKAKERIRAEIEDNSHS